MFGLFDSKESVGEAKIFFGSHEESRDVFLEIKNPFTKEVVSKYPKCDEYDAKRALEVANKASIEAKKVPLHQRIKWLEDVANSS